MPILSKRWPQFIKPIHVNRLVTLLVATLTGIAGLGSAGVVAAVEQIQTEGLRTTMKEIPESGSGAPGSSHAARDWSVDIAEQGRQGSVNYREAAGVLSFHWEFGGGDIVASIHVGDEAGWRAQQPWAVGRRAEILRRVADEVVRQKSPGSRAEIDDQAGWIHIRAGTPPVLPAPQRGSFVTRLTTWKLILGLVVLGVVIIVIAARSVLTISSPTGSPLGHSVRAPEHIVTLIQALEPYVPSLHRNPANDRYRLALFLYPVDGRSAGRLIPIVKQRPAGEFRLAKLLGCDGRTVWFALSDIGGVNLATGKLVGPAELRAANPSLNETWDDPRRFSFDRKLRVTSPDRQTVWEVDPETLQAGSVRVERAVTNLPFEPALQDFLCSYARPVPTEWLGLHSLKEAERDYRPKSWLTRDGRPEETKDTRRFYRGQLGPELDRGQRAILSMAAVSDDEYLNAAFVRGGLKADAVRFSDPDGFLMIYTSAPGLGGTLVVARVDTAGKLIWKTDTGIDRFKLSQVLPDTRYPAFIGTRPSVPGKVSEPILVVVDTQSGAPTTSTLWK